jgi:hypothetical protein
MKHIPKAEERSKARRGRVSWIGETVAAPLSYDAIWPEIEAMEREFDRPRPKEETPKIEPKSPTRSGLGVKP